MGRKRIIVIALLLFAIKWGLTCPLVQAQDNHIDAFRDVGMGRGLTLLHPANRLDRLLKLVRASTVIALYDDYAIINDRYIISNKNKSDTSVTCALPRSGYFKTTLIDSVKFSSFPYLSAVLNGETISFTEGRVADSLITNDGCRGVRDWYVSKIILPPGTSVLNVRSMVNTHDASMINGRNIEHSHGFGYILSTLNSWNANFDFRMYILSKLTQGVPLQGVYPLHGFKTSGNKYIYDLRLTAEAVPFDVVIRYGHISMYTPQNKSNIRSISSDAGQLIAGIAKINPWNIKTRNYHPIYLDNFRPFPSASFSIGGIILAFALLFGTVLFFIIRSGMGQIRQMRRKKQNSGSDQ